MVLSNKYKVVFSSCLLFFVPILNMAHLAVDRSAKYEFLFYQYPKYLDWMVSLGTDRVVAIIYISCALIRPKFDKVLSINIWWIYFFYEISRLIDLFLTYESTPFREYFGYFLVIFQFLYASIYIVRND